MGRMIRAAAPDWRWVTSKSSKKGLSAGLIGHAGVMASTGVMGDTEESGANRLDYALLLGSKYVSL